VRNGNTNPNRNFPERSQQRPPEPLQMSWIATGMAAAGEKIKTKLTTEGEAKSKN
jgi:hypothetical protein